MDQKRAERLIFENIEIDCDHPLDVTVSRAAKMILDEFEEELQAARRESGAAILPCGHHATNAQEDGGCRMCEVEARVAVLKMLGASLERQRDQLQAQVAVMAVDIREVQHLIGKPAPVTFPSRRRAYQKLEHALSAAPKVVWSQVVELIPSGRKKWPALYMYAVGSEAHSHSEIGEYRGELMGYPEGMAGTVRFIVLDCQRHREQGEESGQED